MFVAERRWVVVTHSRVVVGGNTAALRTDGRHGLRREVDRLGNRLSLEHDQAHYPKQLDGQNSEEQWHDWTRIEATPRHDTLDLCPGTDLCR